MQNAGSGSTASLGKVARGGAAAAPTIVEGGGYQLNPVSAKTIEMLTGVKLPAQSMANFEGNHSRSGGRSR